MKVLVLLASRNVASAPSGARVVAGDERLVDARPDDVHDDPMERGVVGDDLVDRRLDRGGAGQCRGGGGRWRSSTDVEAVSSSSAPHAAMDATLATTRSTLTVGII